MIMHARKSKTINIGNKLTALLAKAPRWLVLALTMAATRTAGYATKNYSEVKAHQPVTEALA